MRLLRMKCFITWSSFSYIQNRRASLFHWWIENRKYSWKRDKFSKLAHGVSVCETDRGFPTMHLHCIVVFFLLKTTQAYRCDNRELSLVNTKLQMSFSLTLILTLVYLCFPRTFDYSAVCRYFLSCTPSFFLSTTLLDSNVLAYDRIILRVPYLHHFTYVDLWRYHSKEIVRDTDWAFSCI